MRKQIKVIAMLLCLVMLASTLVSCKLFNTDDNKDKKSGSTTDSSKSEASKFTEKELNTPVITIGKRTVSLARFLEVFEQVKSYYSSSYGYDIASDSETLSQYIDLICDTIVEETMELHKADELGISNLNDEQKAELDKRYQAEIDEMNEYYTEYAKDELGESGTAEDIAAKVEEYILDEAKYYCGDKATLDDYKEYLRTQAESDYIRELLKAEIIKDVKVSDDDIKKWYDDSLADDKEYFAEHPETYKDEVDSYEMTGFISDGKTAVPPLYVPANYFRVYDIFITNDKELSETYKTNLEKMSELKAEYGELAFENAISGATTAGNATRMSEILKEYNKLEKANNSELKKAYKPSKTKIDEIYEKLENGEDFKELMLANSQDANFKEGGAFAEKGRLISASYASTSDWSDIIKDKFKGLVEGEYSKVFLGDDGYHIIYVASRVTAGDVKLDDIKDIISAQLLTDQQNSYFDTQKEEWLENKGAVKKNIELLGKVGK